MGEVAHLAGEAVNEQDRRARAFIQIMDAGAVDFDEAAKRRHRLLDLPRRPCSKQGEPGQHEAERNDGNADDPGQHHHSRAPIAGSRTGAAAGNAIAFISSTPARASSSMTQASAAR